MIAIAPVFSGEPFKCASARDQPFEERNWRIELLFHRSKHDQGIIRTGRGEEQPGDKDRAQKVHRSEPGKTSPTREETREGMREYPTRSGKERADQPK